MDSREGGAATAMVSRAVGAQGQGGSSREQTRQKSSCVETAVATVRSTAAQGTAKVTAVAEARGCEIGLLSPARSLTFFGVLRAGDRHRWRHGDHHSSATTLSRRPTHGRTVLLRSGRRRHLPRTCVRRVSPRREILGRSRMGVRDRVVGRLGLIILF